MKPTLTLLLLATVLYANAQKNWYLKPSFGISSRPLIQAGGGFLDFTLFGGASSAGTFGAEVLRQTGRFKTGIAVTYENITVTTTDFDFFGGSAPRSYTVSDTKTLAVLATAYYSFMQHKQSSFYSGMAIGPAFNWGEEYEKGNVHNTAVGYQFTAIGYSYQSPDIPIGLFIEAGYGYKGLMCGGLQVKF